MVVLVADMKIRVNMILTYSKGIFCFLVICIDIEDINLSVKSEQSRIF